MWYVIFFGQLKKTLSKSFVWKMRNSIESQRNVESLQKFYKGKILDYKKFVRSGGGCLAAWAEEATGASSERRVTPNGTDIDFLRLCGHGANAIACVRRATVACTAAASVCAWTRNTKCRKLAIRTYIYRPADRSSVMRWCLIVSTIIALHSQPHNTWIVTNLHITSKEIQYRPYLYCIISFLSKTSVTKLILLKSFSLRKTTT